MIGKREITSEIMKEIKELIEDDLLSLFAGCEFQLKLVIPVKKIESAKVFGGESSYKEFA